MKNVGLSILLIFLRTAASAQEDPMDYVIDSLVREHHIKRMRIDVQVVNGSSDTTMWLETRYFDARGNKIKTLAPKSQGRYYKAINLYDSLNRRILYRSYDEKDTNIFRSETKWIYTDSMHYRKEEYDEGSLITINTYFIKTSGDTMWVTDDEYNLDYNRYDHRVSRYRMIGDTLLISEYIKYDDSLHMEGLDTYYQVWRDLDTGYLTMAGQYRVQMCEWDRFHLSDSLTRDFYMHPDKYIQMQLDGEFAYEYDEEPFTYQIYNYNNQLLQNERGIYKRTYEYNAKGQLEKVTIWGQHEGEDDYGITVRGYVYYEYSDNGLPIKVTTEYLPRGSGSLRILHYSYTY